MDRHDQKSHLSSHLLSHIFINFKTFYLFLGMIKTEDIRKSVYFTVLSPDLVEELSRRVGDRAHG